jgi:hypothetical protein
MQKLSRNQTENHTPRINCALCIRIKKRVIMERKCLFLYQKNLQNAQVSSYSADCGYKTLLI